MSDETDETGETDTIDEMGQIDEDGDPAGTTLDSLEDILPDCPHCGRTVWVVSVRGPSRGIASPCGCPVVPDTLERR